MTEPMNGLAPQNEAGKFDELVAATIRTAVDEWRAQNDPADEHGMGMPEYIRRSLADAGLLAPYHLTHSLCLKWDETGNSFTIISDGAEAGHVVALTDAVRRSVREHDAAQQELERLRLERADVRAIVRSIGEEPIAPDVPTRQVVSWLVDEYKKLLEQNEELTGELDTAEAELAKVRGAAAPADVVPLRERIAEAFAELDTRDWGGDHGFTTYGNDDESDAFVDAAHNLVAAEMERLAGVVVERGVVIRQLTWLHAEAVWHAQHHQAQAEQLGGDKNIRQGALNGVLGRPRSADYYEAIEAVADLVKERRRLTARLEAEGLPLTLLRKGVRGLLDQIDAMARQIKALQAQLDQAHETASPAPKHDEVLDRLRAAMRKEQAAAAAPQRRVWAPGSPAPDKSVTEVIAENDVTFQRTNRDLWHAKPPEGNGRDYAWAWINEHLTVTEVLPAPSASPREEGDGRASDS